jgi:transcriptional regulator with PAS, ATPase and Fis domain
MGEFLGEMVEQIKKNEINIGGITGSSEEIKKIRELVLKYSLEEEPVLLLGETGIGKSHIAELIHKYSGRKGKFFTINTPGIPNNLLESEIFGHKKGAFTDAKFDKKGFVDEARGGTLLFDEISEVPVSFQAKLLRFIDTKKYIVLGESAEREADVRIVAATNKDLQKAIKTKEFREDLYFRLQVLEIEIPPLRERKQDIKTLVMEMQRCLRGKEIGSDFWEAVYNHDWPGNVRELITVLTRAGILVDSPITGKDIRDIINQSRCKDSFNRRMDKIEQIRDSIKAGKSFWETVKTPYLNRDLNRDEVKEIIKRGLAQAKGKYKNLLTLFNLEDNEYKKFMKFLNGNLVNIV